MGPTSAAASPRTDRRPNAEYGALAEANAVAWRTSRAIEPAVADMSSGGYRASISDGASPPLTRQDVRVAALADIVFDCAHPATLARFWAAALDGHEVAPYDGEELVRLRSLGIDNVEDDPTVLVQPTNGGGPRLWFHLVPEPKRVKNRVHLDLRADDVSEELARLVALGAVAIDDQPTGDVVILRDPEGNEFCLVRP